MHVRHSISHALLVTSVLLFSATAYATTIAPTDDIPDNGTQYTCPNLTQQLKKYDCDSDNTSKYCQRKVSGDQVSQLQQFLSDYFDVDESVILSGLFGKGTERYVKQFQQQYNLPAYGLVGSLTRAKIAEVCEGGVTVVTPTNPGTPIISLSVDKNSVNPGDAVTVTWNAQNATRCWMQHGPQAGVDTELPNIGTSGQKQFNPYQSYRVSVGCANELHPQMDGPQDKKTIFVTVGGVTSNTAVLVAQPEKGVLETTYNGQPITPTRWVTVTVSGYNPVGGEMVDWGNGVRSALRYTSTLNARHDYHTAGTYTVRLLRSGDGDASVVAQTVVTVLPVGGQVGITADLKVNGSDGPLFVADNQPMQVTWSSTNAHHCSINGARRTEGGSMEYFQNLGGSGSLTMYPYLQTQTPLVSLGCYADAQAENNPVVGNNAVDIVSLHTSESGKKCGVTSFSVQGQSCNVMGTAYRDAKFQCYDGFSGSASVQNTCITSDVLRALAEKTCASHCSTPRPDMCPIAQCAQMLCPAGQHFESAAPVYGVNRCRINMCAGKCVADVSSGQTQITLKTPIQDSVYSIGGSIPISWSIVGNTTPKSQVLIKLEGFHTASGVGGGTWQSSELALGNSTGAHDWQTGGGYLSAAGTYKVTAYVVACDPQGCEYNYQNSAAGMAQKSIATSQTILINIPDGRVSNEKCTGFVFTKNQQVFDQGGETAEIRKFLNFSLPFTEQEDFFSLDMHAYVDAFQRKYNLNVGDEIGVWNALTRAKANAINATCGGVSGGAAIRVVSPNGGESFASNAQLPLTVTLPSVYPGSARLCFNIRSVAGVTNFVNVPGADASDGCLPVTQRQMSVMSLPLSIPSGMYKIVVLLKVPGINAGQDAVISQDESDGWFTVGTQSASLSFTSSPSGQYTQGIPFDFAYTAEGAPPKSQVEIEVHRVVSETDDGVVELWRWQSGELPVGSSRGVHSSSQWDVGTAGFPTSTDSFSPGKYQWWGFVVSCNPLGCDKPRLGTGLPVNGYPQYADYGPKEFHIVSASGSGSAPTCSIEGYLVFDGIFKTHLTWSSANATKATINDPYIGSGGAVALNGSYNSLATDRAFTLTVSGAGGTNTCSMRAPQWERQNPNSSFKPNPATQVGTPVGSLKFWW